MHSYDHTIAGRNYTVHHNGDYSGDLKIDMAASAVEPGFPPDNGRVTVSVPFTLLADIVAQAVSAERISFYEEAATWEVLGMQPRGDR